MRRKAYLALQIALTVLLLALLLRGFDWTSFGALFRRLPTWYYVASLAAVLLGQVTYAWRWRVLLVAVGAPVSFGAVVRQHFVALFVSNFLPSTVGGDVVKVYYLGRAYGYRQLTASVLLDRLLGVGVLAVIAACAAWANPVFSPRYAIARTAVTAVAVVALAIPAALLGAGFVTRLAAGRGGWLAAAASQLQQFQGDVRTAIRQPAVWLQVTAVVASYVVAVAALYAVFIGLQTGHRPNAVALLAAVSAALVLSNVPVTVNGLGLREQLHVYLLEPLGVPKEVAVALSLLFFAHQLVSSLAGGVLWAKADRLPRDAEQPRLEGRPHAC